MNDKYLTAGISRIPAVSHSAILSETISDGGLTPTTDTDLLLSTYRGGSHFTSDIFYLRSFGPRFPAL